MMQRAMPFSKLVSPRRAFALGVLLALAAPLSAQVMPDPDAAEVAKTPLRDFNIDAQDIPPLLAAAAADPYAVAGLGTCNALVADIAALDSVLGADYDIADESDRGGISAGRVGQSVFGAIIPFRGVLREVTGAAANDRELQAAYTAGMVRRSFLKGVGLGRSCTYPARPKADAGDK